MSKRATICQQLYPKLYRAAAKRIIFLDLPLVISDTIHQCRDLADLSIQDSKVDQILGYGQSSVKDRMLDNVAHAMNALQAGNVEMKADKQVP